MSEFPLLAQALPIMVSLKSAHAQIESVLASGPGPLVERLTAEREILGGLSPRPDLR